MQTTANLGLNKPEGIDVVNIQDFNDNADLLDNYAAATATLIGTKAPLASPALMGTPTAPTAAVDTSTTQVASTAFVLGQAGMTAPLMSGTAGVGTSKRYARADHVHPIDTSRAAQIDFVAHLAEDATEAHLPLNVGLGNVDNVKQMPISGGTFTGAVYPQINTSYTTGQSRRIRLYEDGQTVPTLSNGEIAIIHVP